MGRPKLYHTSEERKAASAARSARYYENNKVAICKARKAKHIPKAKSSERPPAIPLTDEEKKVKDRAKSKRCYERNKSKVRKARNPKHVNWSFFLGANGPTCSTWNKRLIELHDQITKALNNKDLPTFVDGVALAYINTGFRGPLDDAPLPFSKILDELDRHEADVLKSVGAGAHTGDITKVRKYLRHIVDLLEHLVIVAIEKEDTKGFLEAYDSGDLMHHLLYFK